MKKILLALLALLTLAIPTQAAQKTFGDVTYSIVTKTNGAREVHITGTATTKNNVIIPATIEELPVTEIADRAFYFDRVDHTASGTITSVTLPNSIKRIGNEAFANQRIKKLTLPNNLKEIGYEAFAHNKLTHITIPKSMQTIGGNIVVGNPVQTYQLPAHFKQPTAKESGKLLYTTFTRYGKQEVRITGHTYTTAQTKILVPQTIQGMPVTEIGDYAFTNKASLLGLEQTKPAIQDVTLPSTIRKIGNHALAGVSYDNNSRRSFTLPAGLEEIGHYAFAGSGLTNRGQTVTFPLTLKTIGDGAFIHNAFKAVTIPFHIKSLGKYAFAHNELTSVTFGNGVKTIPTGAFFANAITNITLPKDLITIGDTAFMHNRLPSLILPLTVQIVGDAAFAHNKLTSISLPNVHTIGHTAFSHNQLIHFDVPHKVNDMPINALLHNPLQSIKVEGSETKLLNTSTSLDMVHLTTDAAHTKLWTKWNTMIPERTTLYVK